MYSDYAWQGKGDRPCFGRSIQNSSDSEGGMKANNNCTKDKYIFILIIQKTATIFLNNGLPLLFQGNYGGDHWLASFAVYALED